MGKRRQSYTQAEINFLKENKDRLTSEELAKELRRSEKSIKQKITQIEKITNNSTKSKITWVSAALLFFALISVLIGLYSILPKSPELHLEVKSKTTFDILNEGEYPSVTFRVYNNGEKSSKSLYYFYYLINQTKNTCYLNKSFFKNWTNMCYFEVKKGDSDKIACQSDTPSAQKDALNDFTITDSFSNETLEFKNYMDSLDISYCELKEIIEICTFHEGMETTDWCTKPIEYTIIYNTSRLQ